MCNIIDLAAPNPSAVNASLRAPLALYRRNGHLWIAYHTRPVEHISNADRSLATIHPTPYIPSTSRDDLTPYFAFQETLFTRLSCWSRDNLRPYFALQETLTCHSIFCSLANALCPCGHHPFARPSIHALTAYIDFPGSPLLAGGVSQASYAATRSSSSFAIPTYSNTIFRHPEIFLATTLTV